MEEGLLKKLEMLFISLCYKDLKFFNFPSGEINRFSKGIESK